MNLRSATYLFALLLCTYVWLGHSTGPGKVQNTDRTGSPLSPDFCQACHSGGNFGTDVQILLLQGIDTIQEYVPETAYTLQVTVAATGAEAFGFQAVALSPDTANAGMFGTPPDGMQITPVNGRDYAEHSQRSSSPTFEIEWTAPGSGKGDITFYVAGNAVNANSSTSGDLPDTSKLTLTEATVSAVQVHLDRNLQLRLAPNPVQNELRLSWSGENQPRKIEIRDMTGRTYKSLESGQLTNQETTIGLDAAPSGIYIVSISTRTGIIAQKFVKL